MKCDGKQIMQEECAGCKEEECEGCPNYIVKLPEWKNCWECMRNSFGGCEEVKKNEQNRR